MNNKFMKKSSKNFINNILSFISALLLSVLIIEFAIQNVNVEGDSMLPTLSSGDKLLIEKVSYYFEEPKIGELIVFKYPADTRKRLIKRIVALEGDRISITNNKLYINGELCNEGYLLEYSMEDFKEVTIPRDTVFVLGDNRNNSSDSRNEDIGFVSKKLIVGKAFYRIYPFNKIGRFN